HQRLGHLGEYSICLLKSKGLVTGMDLHPEGALAPCDGCAKGKSPQAPFPKEAANRSKARLERLHMDLQGP
ncbi:hypothetical protein FA95DRAFT_1477554, partial [Auriscalpium vulgare]